MLRRLSKALAVGLFAAGLAGLLIHLHAQEETPVFTTGIKEVTLNVSVLDKNGRMITTVPRSAFKVFEDNVEQPIKYFRREDVPVSMGILVDNSGSMNDKRARVAAAALALVKASNPDDEVFIVGTAMRSAISGAIDYMKTDAKLDKKVIVVVTDGNDNASGDNPTLEQLVRKVRDSGILVYSIGLLSEEEPREARAAKRALNSLAEATGASTYYPKDLAEVEKITPEIAHEIRNQYTVVYTPLNENLDGSFRKIKVELSGQYRGATVRTKNGYYATPETPRTASSLGRK
jgi:Ca-activated chloride channel homolog